MGPTRAALKLYADDTDAALLTPLGEFMQRRNAELGLSVAAVAQRVGMSRATWYRIARGESASPGVRVLRGLARVYKVRAAELFALAEHAVAPPAAPSVPSIAPRGPIAQAVREPGDALWRCRHAGRVRAGSWIDVQLELLNLSDQTWRHAEVRGFLAAWILLSPRSEGLGQAIAAEVLGLRACRAPLPLTAPNEWARAHVRLQAPPVAGTCIFCLSLHTEPAAAPVGAGVFLSLETG